MTVWGNSTRYVILFLTNKRLLGVKALVLRLLCHKVLLILSQSDIRNLSQKVFGLQQLLKEILLKPNLRRNQKSLLKQKSRLQKPKRQPKLKKLSKTMSGNLVEDESLRLAKARKMFLKMFKPRKLRWKLLQSQNQPKKRSKKLLKRRQRSQKMLVHHHQLKKRMLRSRRKLIK